MVTITDPRYALQWHFDLMGDIETVWQDYSGSGVAVAVYDDGMDQAHEDLRANYDSSLHYRGLSSDDGRHNGPTDGHGTSVGGLIAAALNGIGGVGVAWEAGLTSVDYLNDLQEAEPGVLQDGLAWTVNFDVVNQSYGVTPDFSDDWDLGNVGYARDEDQQIAQAVANGRGGLGTVFVKAAGNEANDPTLTSLGVLGNAQGEGGNVSHRVIVVGAVGRDGSVADYSNFGANLLVSAPAASHTTDVTGSAGYARGAYTNDFGGTSAAAPLVSGVVALMLEAEPGLGWRDVQEILALTAAQTGSAYGAAATGFEAGEWRAMAGTTWNGGAATFNPSYGFGLVDAFAAVRLSEVWLEMQGAPATQDTLLRASALESAHLRIEDLSEVAMVLEETERLTIEHLNVTVDLGHGFASDLTLTLVAPDGTEVILSEGDGGGTAVRGDWTYGVSALRGMSSAGEWTLLARDGATGGTGRLYSVELEFFGRPETVDDLWVFTDDFETLALAEPERRAQADGNGGTDWISTVAVARDVTVALGPTSEVRVAGALWSEITGGIEHVSTGDGADVLTGSAGANLLLAGRGRDVLTGGAGADSLTGGPGDDLLQGGEGGLYHTAIAAQVYRLYLSVFGREPDAAGHQFWAQQVTLGKQTLEQVAAAFVASAEFQTTYGATDDPQFVTLLYTNVLGRAPEPAGLAGWVDRLDSGVSRSELVWRFSESPEHQASTAPAQQHFDARHDITEWTDDVYRLFRAIFDRDPDPGGYTAWTDTLASGTMGFARVVDSFMGSPEFRATYGGATDSQTFVTLLYNNVLDRAPEPNSLSGWVTALEGGMNRVAVVSAFMASPEFVDRTADGLTAFMTGLGEDDVLRADAGSDILSGGLYADRFVFVSDGAAGTVTVTDLEPWDILEFEGFAYDEAGLFAALSQQGADVMLVAGDERLIFLETDLADLSVGMVTLA